MPELPEVELVRRAMMRYAIGETIESIEILDEGVLETLPSSLFVQMVTGRTIRSIDRLGKQLILLLDDGSVLSIHLGMTGDVLKRILDAPERYLRLSLSFASGTLLDYIDQRKFGAVGWYPSHKAILEKKMLGPDALSINEADFLKNVGEHHRSIKTVLLDQKLLAGVGNLYSDEMLFQCRIHPEKPACQLTTRQVRCLHKAMQEVLNLSLDIGSDFELMPQKFMLKVRGKGGECPRCGYKWSIAKVNGRTSFFCENCQPLKRCRKSK